MAPQAMRLWTSRRGPTASSKNDLGDVGGRRPERRGFKWSRGRGSDGASPPGHPSSPLYGPAARSRQPADRVRDLSETCPKLPGSCRELPGRCSAAAGSWSETSPKLRCSETHVFLIIEVSEKFRTSCRQLPGSCRSASAGICPLLPWSKEIFVLSAALLYKADPHSRGPEWSPSHTSGRPRMLAVPGSAVLLTLSRS